MGLTQLPSFREPIYHKSKTYISIKPVTSRVHTAFKLLQLRGCALALDTVDDKKNADQETLFIPVDNSTWFDLHCLAEGSTGRLKTAPVVPCARKMHPAKPGS